MVDVTVRLESIGTANVNMNSVLMVHLLLNTKIEKHLNCFTYQHYYPTQYGLSGTLQIVTKPPKSEHAMCDVTNNYASHNSEVNNTSLS